VDSGLAGVILAAGASSRMGRDKALLPWPPFPLDTPHSKIERGRAGLMQSHPSRKKRENDGVTTSGVVSTGTILSYAIQTLSQVCDLVIVVAGNNEKALEAVAYGGGAFLVRNPSPERGQFSSLQTGLHDVLNRGWDNAMITLVDRPPASAATLTRLAGEFQKKDHGVWAIVPEYQGKHGHPILIGREMIEAFLRAPATAHAREIEHANQERIAYVPVNDTAVAANVDTPEEYAKSWL
jgi:molybdenum cofactor cytidylyltransferase